MLDRWIPTQEVVTATLPLAEFEPGLKLMETGEERIDQSHPQIWSKGTWPQEITPANKKLLTAPHLISYWHETVSS
jgi:hypothetical protein